MTKQRHPLTIENALYKVLGALSIERAAEITGKEMGYLQSLSNPDNRYRLTCEDALLLDAEHAAQFGERPIHTAMGVILDARDAAQFAERAQLARLSVPVIKEAGEASAALVAATLAGAGPRELVDFIRQAEESIAETTRAIGVAKSMLDTSQQRPP